MKNRLNWNLNKLFKSKENFESTIKKIKKDLKMIQKFNDIEFDNKSLLDILNFKWSIKEKVNSVLIYGSLIYYQDINSIETKKIKLLVEKLNADVDFKLGFINEKIIKLGQEIINEFINQNDKLEIYRFHLNNIFRLRNHIQNTSDINESKNKINESLTKYNEILHNINYGEITDNDKIIKIAASNFAKYISSRNREIRKNTYLVVNKSFNESIDKFSELLNIIYKERIKISNIEKYNSVFDKALFEENIDPLILNRLIESVNKNLPIIWKYLKIKGRILNVNDFHLYDLGVSLDENIKNTYSIFDAIEIIKKALSPLGEKYMTIVEELLNGDYIDAEPNDKKHQSITFSWSTYSFMNFRGSYNDVKNLVHELGHIVNAYLSKQKQPYIYEDSSIFIGEIASLVNEILLNKYLYENANNKEEKIFYLSKQIENFFVQIYKQTMYTEFENELYNKATKNLCLTPELLNKKYFSIIKKYYGNNVIYDELGKVEWTRLGHLYRWSYYVYKYATGLLMASVIVHKTFESQQLINDEYIEFLSAGSSDDPLKLLKIINIDLSNESVINSGFLILEKAVDDFAKLIDI